MTASPGGPARPGNTAVTTAATALIIGGLAGCGGGRDALETGAGACVRALPVAHQAVAGHGRLAGLKLLTVPAPVSKAAAGLRPLLRRLPAQRAICLVAYSGRFAATQVAHPLQIPGSGPMGRYALVAVNMSDVSLVGTFVLQREPTAMARSHIY